MNTFGRRFRLTTFGESHGPAIGAVVDGCPAGLEVGAGDIQAELDKRKPGQSSVTSGRKEPDRVEILSGLFEGKTTGMPIAMLVRNVDVDSSAYENIKDLLRPGHADYGYLAKYGFRDHRGGGRSSGRETAGRVMGGAVAKKLLSLRGIHVYAHTASIYDVKAGEVTPEDIINNTYKNPVRCADPRAVKEMEEAINMAKRDGDSVGGTVEVIATGVPAGLGEPVFGKLDADLAGALMGIGAVKGVEVGLGFGAASLRGSEVNDEFYWDGGVRTRTNRAGGILGGISTGMPIVCRIAVKPTPSISKPQQTVNVETKEDAIIEIKGRHDPSIVPRIVPVVEAMTALVIADHMLISGRIGPALP
ncbi:chorismate synthase [Methanocella paludicola SANAE]|uniref:Chorismate synthase n=1 Tax=Methanocella paludicola (strain DSM 17711 / JCM 13418 / NBRC 101707 / SANAE) TaxID=304371 RepID=D1Z1V1_METPS|nr:chorismate synthase [Methanocella paludicola]BAI62673.1 chorismate synthase [Methanocella paludicola SANAE]